MNKMLGENTSLFILERMRVLLLNKGWLHLIRQTSNCLKAMWGSIYVKKEENMPDFTLLCLSSKHASALPEGSCQ